MQKNLYNQSALWLTLSVTFFLVEYSTDWLEVVTLGGLVAGSFIEGIFLLLGGGVMRLVVSKEFKNCALARLTERKADLAKALVILAAFSWEGALTLSHVMPGYMLHVHAGHLLFLLVLQPALTLVLDLYWKKE